MNTIAEVLRGAAAMIQEKGLGKQGDLLRHPCMVHAVADTAGGVKNEALVTLTLRLLSKTVGVGNGYLVQWNDVPERTQQEVVDALLAAAEIAEQESMPALVEA